MKRWLMSLCLPALLLWTSGARASGLPRKSPEPPPQVTIRLYDQAALPPEVLRKATEIAGNILGQAGVQAVWLSCVGPTNMLVCDDPLFTPDYRVFLLPKEAETKLPVPTRGLAFVLQHPQRGVGQTAWVFYARVQRLSEEERLPSDLLLGHVIAHELGHLLLGSVDHPGNGLMRRRWSEKELRDATQESLYFSGSQAKAIRAAVRRRPSEQSSMLALVSSMPR